MTGIFLIAHESHSLNSCRLIVLEGLELRLLKHSVVYALISLPVLQFLPNERKTILVKSLFFE